METLLTGVVALVIGFVIGASMMLNSWEASAKRGMFEVGHVVYRVQPVSP